MSFREKSAWISALSMLGIYGFYFWSVFTHRTKGDGSHAGLLETIIAVVVLQVVLTVAVAIFSPKEAKAPRDEREKLIELRSMRVAYAGLATSVALACFFGAFDPPILFNTTPCCSFL
jgi:hypothetical protein